MHSTQLTCPHCGSTLSFGTEIAAGSPVECLICMQSFAAEPIAAPPVAAHASAITEKPLPTAVKPDKSRSIQADSRAGGKIALAAIAVGLFLLLTAGVSFAIWKATATTKRGPVEGKNELVAQSNKPGTDNNAAVPAPPVLPKDNVPPGPDDPEQPKPKPTPKSLVKNPIKPPDNELPPAPVVEIKVPAPVPVLIPKAVVGLDAQKINLAIDKGILYLKNTQHLNGTWGIQQHTVGYASIGGLTLLECQVPTTDVAVQRSAAYVRDNIAQLTATYELSLAILFLDRLGEARDRPLIQGMALRILAGQNDCGGWSYGCPILNPQEMFQLYAFLRSHKKLDLLNPVQDMPKNPAAILLNPTLDPSKMSSPFYQLNELILAQGIEGPNRKDPMPAPKDPPAVKPKPAKNPSGPIRPDRLNPNLRNLPVVQNQGKGKAQMLTLRHGNGDNSNTQFALLALWAARRHDVITDQALLASYQRFVASQTFDGGWGYFPAKVHGSTPSMTCVGLLGLAMGHGAAPDVVGNAKNPKDIVVKPALDDKKIQAGLRALARNIGRPSQDPTKIDFPLQNLYFLWSLERVAMLYDLKAVDGKDWYSWGAQILVHTQNSDGFFESSHYHGMSGPLNTCFALLFLKRSNLVQDLTNSLRFYTGVREP